MPSSLKLSTLCFISTRRRLDTTFTYPMFRYESGKKVIGLPSILGNLLSEQVNGLHEAGPYKSSLLQDQWNSSPGRAIDSVIKELSSNKSTRLRESLPRRFEKALSPSSTSMSDSPGQKVDKPHARKTRHIRFLAFSMSRCHYFMAKERSRRFSDCETQSINLSRVSPIYTINA